MKPITLILVVSIVLALGAASPVSASDEAITSAIANKNRTDADRKRDAYTRPDVILGLLDLDSGQALQNNYGYAKWVEKYLQERYIDNTIPPITVLRSEVPDLMLEPESLDAVLMSMSYHDLYYYNPDVGFERADVNVFDKTIRGKTDRFILLFEKI
jgi:hypothetical protein